MPVYIIGTYNADSIPNAMNAAWGGISKDKEISYDEETCRLAGEIVNVSADESCPG